MAKNGRQMIRKIQNVQTDDNNRSYTENNFNHAYRILVTLQLKVTPRITVWISFIERHAACPATM